MSTRITNLIRDRLMHLAKMEVILRMFKTDLGIEIAETHEALRIKTINIINEFFPPKEMAIIKKYGRGFDCEGVRIDLSKNEEFLIVVCPFDQIINYHIRGEFYKNLFSEYSNPDGNKIPEDKLYSKAQKENYKILYVPQSYHYRDTCIPGLENYGFSCMDATSKPLFNPIIADARIFKSMLIDLGKEVDVKSCPYISLIKVAKNFETISKVWPEAKRIFRFIEQKKNNKGSCKIMDIEEATQQIQHDMAEAN